MNPSIICYGGVAEIGGNKVLLEDGEARLFLDFGIAFGRQQAFFNEYLRPRTARGLLDLLALGLIPPLEGLYREDLAPPGLWERFRERPLYLDLRRGGAPSADAVLISHAHLDHNGDLSYLDPTIPVHATRVTAFIARTMQITGQSSFEREMTYVNPRQWNEKEQALKSQRRAPYRARACTFLDGSLGEEACRWWETSPTSKPLETAAPEVFADEVAGLEVRWWAVDHSIPGAAAFAVRTSAGWIGYSGDIRFHGQKAPAMERLIQDLAALEPLALLCEGTHLADDDPITGQEVAANALELVRQAEGRLVVADFAPRNVERLLTFLDVAGETGRWLAVQPKDACLLHAVALADPHAFPDPFTLSNLALYADPKSAPRSWEVALRQRWASRTVGPAEVSAQPGDYILCFSLWDANDLLDLQDIEGGVYLYSNSRAYDEEQAVDLERLRNWVRHVGLKMEGDPDDPQAVPLHASGHATGPQLRDFVRRVRPRTLIPIHTENPAWWRDQLAGTGIHVVLPQVGQPVPLR
jgi:ribonuclease J